MHSRSLWTLLAAGLALTLLPGAAAAQPIHPQWSPDGEWIAFYERVGDQAAIRRVRPDGSDLETVVSDGGYHANPSWSADGRSITVASSPEGMNGTWDVFTIDLTRRDWARLTDTPEREMHTHVSVGGSVAFVRMTADGSDVWTVDASGIESQVTHTPAREFHPKWAPDGTRLAFDSTEDGRQVVRIYDVASGVTTTLPGTGARAGTPAWFPDSDRLVFGMQDAEGTTNLYSARPDGSERVRLTDLAGETGAPFVSPDGGQVAFHSNHEGGWGIYVLDLADGAVTRIDGGS